MKSVTLFVFALIVAATLAAPSPVPIDENAGRGNPENRDGKFLGLFGGLGLWGYGGYGGFGYGYGGGYPYYGGYGGYPYGGGYGGYPYGGYYYG